MYVLAGSELDDPVFARTRGAGIAEAVLGASDAHIGIQPWIFG